MPDVKRNQPVWRRALRSATTLTLTGLVLGLAAALVTGGTGLIAQRAAAVEGPDPAPLAVVATTPIRIEPGYTVTRRFVGQIEAVQQTQIAFETGGTVEEVGVDEGDRVARGAVIARLDTRLLKAEADRLRATRDALSAQAELARRTTDRQTALSARGFASDQALDQASLGLVELTARIAEIDAALVSVDIRLEKAVLRAPFDARVAARQVDLGATVAGGQPVVTLLEDRAPQFRVGLDPDLAGTLAPDTPVRIEIDGRMVEAELISILPGIDPATRTRSALFRLPDTTTPAFGTTATLTIDDTVAADGAWIPTAALRQGVRGLWTVLTVTQDAEGATTVGTEAVEIIHADATRAFVRGTFADGTPVVTDGAHRVVPGQRVRLAEAG